MARNSNNTIDISNQPFMQNLKDVDDTLKDNKRLLREKQFQKYRKEESKDLKQQIEFEKTKLKYMNANLAGKKDILKQYQKELEYQDQELKAYQKALLVRYKALADEIKQEKERHSEVEDTTRAVERNTQVVRRSVDIQRRALSEHTYQLSEINKLKERQIDYEEDILRLNTRQVETSNQQVGSSDKQVAKLKEMQEIEETLGTIGEQRFKINQQINSLNKISLNQSRELARAYLENASYQEKMAAIQNTVNEAKEKEKEITEEVRKNIEKINNDELLSESEKSEKIEEQREIARKYREEILKNTKLSTDFLLNGENELARITASLLSIDEQRTAKQEEINKLKKTEQDRASEYAKQIQTIENDAFLNDEEKAKRKDELREQYEKEKLEYQNRASLLEEEIKNDDKELEEIELQNASLQDRNKKLQERLDKQREEESNIIKEYNKKELEYKRQAEKEGKSREEIQAGIRSIRSERDEKIGKSREEAGVPRGLFDALRRDWEANRDREGVGREVLQEGLNSLLNGDGLGKAFGSAVEVALPKFSAMLGPVITILSTIASLVRSASNMLQQGIQNSLDDQATYLGKMNSRLQGSDESYQKIVNTLTSNFASSPFISQRKALENIASLVEAGTAVNIEQRGVLMTLSDKMVSTFDALDATLTRMIRIQQSDITAGQLGYEALLTEFLNSQFSDTSYLSDMYDSINASLIDAASQFDAKMASEFTYTVQKWLGSLYSVGMSSEGVSKIAQGISYLATGNVEALNGDDSLRNLFAMATQGAYSDILVNGLNVDTTNALLEKVVKYLQSIAGDTNQVTKQAMSGVFGGLSFSDLRATTNLTNETLSAIYDNVKSYDSALAETQLQLYYAIKPYQNEATYDWTTMTDGSKSSAVVRANAEARYLESSVAEQKAHDEGWRAYHEVYQSYADALDQLAGIKVLFSEKEFEPYKAKLYQALQEKNLTLDIEDYKLFTTNFSAWSTKHEKIDAATASASTNSNWQNNASTTTSYLASLRNSDTNSRFAYTNMYDTLLENELYTFGNNYISNINDYQKYARRRILSSSGVPIVSTIAGIIEGIDELFNGGFNTLLDVVENTFATNMSSNVVENAFATNKSSFESNFSEASIIRQLNNQIENSKVVSRGGNRTYIGTPSNITTGISSMVRMDLSTPIGAQGILSNIQGATSGAGALPATTVTDFSTNVPATASTVNSVVGTTISKDVSALYSELFEKQTTSMKVSISDIDLSALSSLGNTILDNTKSTVAISNIADSVLNSLSETMHVDRLDNIDDKISSGVDVNVNESFVDAINNGLMYARSI